MRLYSNIGSVICFSISGLFQKCPFTFLVCSYFLSLPTRPTLPLQNQNQNKCPPAPFPHHHLICNCISHLLHPWPVETYQSYARRSDSCWSVCAIIVTVKLIIGTAALLQWHAGSEEHWFVQGWCRGDDGVGQECRQTDESTNVTEGKVTGSGPRKNTAAS